MGRKVSGTLTNTPDTGLVVLVVNCCSNDVLNLKRSCQCNANPYPEARSRVKF